MTAATKSPTFFRSRVRILARQMGAKVIEDPRNIGDGEAITLRNRVACSRTILVPVLGDEKSYWIALHELGHHQRKGQDRRTHQLQREYGAWEWARANAKVEPTTEIIAFIKHCLMTYHTSLGIPNSEGRWPW